MPTAAQKAIVDTDIAASLGRVLDVMIQEEGHARIMAPENLADPMMQYCIKMQELMWLLLEVVGVMVPRGNAEGAKVKLRGLAWLHERDADQEIPPGLLDA